VERDEVPPDLVTLGSRLTVRDVGSGRVSSVTLASPEDADASAGRVSVLAPLGQAVFGRRVGAEVSLRSPAGDRRVRIESLAWQPESASPSPEAPGG
jgi:regulator of nucleoside diphosphate kinase